MGVVDDFKARASAVRAYLKSIQSLEARYNVPGKGFYKAAAAINASRASAFIMMYNCVEFGARSAVVSIRTEIKKSVSDFSDVGEYWRVEIARAHFQEPLKAGVNHIDFINTIVSFMPGRIDWKAAETSMPFAGNIDNLVLIDFCRKIGSTWKPPKSVLGGSYLRLVRQMRNDLAHGAETFGDVGSQFTTDDLLMEFENVKKFMISFLGTIERYKAKQLYRA